MTISSNSDTIVLVHGSCHGGWCWNKLIPLLKRHHNEIHAPTLTGLGERSHLLYENINLSTHIKDIIQVFEYQNLHDVVLIGHSYGGMVIGGIAERIPDRIKSMIFLDAYIPQDGKSAFDLIPGLKDIYEHRSLKEQGKEWLVLSYTPQEFGVTDYEDIVWMKSRLCPMPFHTHDEFLTIQNIKSKKLPKTYVTFTDFGETMFDSIGHEKAEGWKYYDLRRGHDAMITAPEELSKLLIKIMAKKS
jgi:pimeloyl-ACP methyl ester carboxylesterase